MSTTVRDGETPRRISVSFLEPKGLEEQVIYVCLRRQVGQIIVEAYSRDDFSYDGAVIRGRRHSLADGSTQTVSNLGHSRCYPGYQEFIAILERENKGKAEYDLLGDCIKLSERLKEIEISARDLKR